MKPQKTIRFDEPIVKQWRTIGLLETDEDNTFRIFVTGSLKRDVEEFLKLVENGEFKLHVRVNPIRETPADEFSALSESFPMDEDKEICENFTWRNVNIGISRLGEMDIPKPYVVVYEIDPPIYPPTPTDPGIFGVLFDDHDQADVRCEVQSGTVKMQLSELDIYWQPTTHVRTVNVSPGNPVEWHEHKQSAGNWSVQITGVAAGCSYFTLRYEKRVIS